MLFRPNPPFGGTRRVADGRVRVQDMVNPSVGQNFLWCLPAIAIGTVFGLKRYRHLEEASFNRIVLWLLSISGVKLLFFDVPGRGAVDTAASCDEMKSVGTDVTRGR